MGSLDESFQKAMVAVNGSGSGKGKKGAKPAKLTPSQAAKMLPEPTGGKGRTGNISDDASELILFIDNDGDLYRQQTTSIIENLKRKLASGKYSHALAPKLWGYLTESGSKKYAKEFGSGGPHQFSTPVRREAAGYMADRFLHEVRNGEHD